MVRMPPTARMTSLNDDVRIAVLPGRSIAVPATVGSRYSAPFGALSGQVCC